MSEWFTNETCAAIEDVTETLALVVNRDIHIEEDYRWIPHAIVLICSLVVLGVGHKIMRPVSAVTAFIGGFAVVYIYADSVECMWRTIIAAVVGVCGLAAMLCLLKTGMFVVGAAAFGTSAHFVYDAIQPRWLESMPVWRGRSAVYWASVVVSTVLGAVIVHKSRKHVMMVVSSLLGGVAFAAGMQGLIDVNDIPAYVWVIIGATATIAGVGVQVTLDRREKKKKDEKKQNNNS
jgi:hypothetical protein